jgi:hypothetical protein
MMGHRANAPIIDGRLSVAAVAMRFRNESKNIGNVVYLLPKSASRLEKDSHCVMNDLERCEDWQVVKSKKG